MKDQKCLAGVRRRPRTPSVRADLKKGDNRKRTELRYAPPSLAGPGKTPHNFGNFLKETYEPASKSHDRFGNMLVIQTRLVLLLN